MPALFLAVVTVVFTAGCTVPYLLAERRAPAGTSFSGALLHPFDHHWYLAGQRSEADQLPRGNRFTTEPEAPNRIPPLYLLAGGLQRLTGMAALVAYHLPRVLAAVALPTVLYLLYVLCFPQRPDRARFAVLLCLFTAGPLTLAPGLGIAARSSERVTESNALFAVGVFPHFAVAYLGLAAAGVSVVMAMSRRPLTKVAVVGGIGGLLLGLTHAFLLLVVVAVAAALLGGWALGGARNGRPDLPGRHLATSIAAILMTPAPFVFVATREQARLERLQGRRFGGAPPDAWWTWFVGFGVVSLLAVIGIVCLLRSEKGSMATRVLLPWAAFQFAVMYVPAAVFERRFSEGLIIPVAGLAAAGLPRWRPDQLLSRAVHFLVLAPLALTAVVLPNILGSAGEELPRPYSELLRQVGEDDIVVASRGVASSLPAYSPGTVYEGRSVETIDYREKRRRKAAYAAAPASTASRRWLRDEAITLVVVDADDPSFAPVALSNPAACLRRTFNQGPFSAYRVDRACLDASLVP